MGIVLGLMLYAVPSIGGELEQLAQAYDQGPRPIVEAKCIGCHGGTPKYPWFRMLPFAMDFMKADVRKANLAVQYHEGFPFKGPGEIFDKVSRFLTVVENETMPPLGYLLFHSKDKLNRDETRVLTSWAKHAKKVTQKRSELIETFVGQYIRPKKVPYPLDNPYSEIKERLGKMLFFDPRLSGSNVMSCASCHSPSFSWGDGLRLGVGHGHKPLSRRTPTILNTAFGYLFFWDGRASSLEEQALAPIQSPQEMNQPLPELVLELKAIPHYVELFEEAFPSEGISERNIARALATFERSVVSGTAPFDRWVEGDFDAISQKAVDGFLVFNTKARCLDCHSGWNFTDGSFHDIGVPGKDLGRGKILRQIASTRHAFKVPSLRNIMDRGPYMHNGSIKTLREVIRLYQLGGISKRPTLSEMITPVDLTTEDVENLVMFLQTLSSETTTTFPRLPNETIYPYYNSVGVSQYGHRKNPFH